MAARIVESDVSAILEDTELTDPQIAPYIISANTLVNQVLGTGTTDILKEIERWLAAHMIASTRERQAEREEAGTAKVKYAGTYGEALHATSYGQMVLALDTTGKMANLSMKTARIVAIKSFD